MPRISSWPVLVCWQPSVRYCLCGPSRDAAASAAPEHAVNDSGPLSLNSRSPAQRYGLFRPCSAPAGSFTSIPHCKLMRCSSSSPSSSRAALNERRRFHCRTPPGGCAPRFKSTGSVSSLEVGPANLTRSQASFICAVRTLHAEDASTHHVSHPRERAESAGSFKFC